MPFPYKRILCAVDFDDYSAGALKEAVALALAARATLHVLHVVPLTPLLDEAATGGLAVGELYQPQIEIAQKQLEKMLIAIPASVRREVTIEIGRPVDLILRMQMKLGAELVVMATHGRKGFKHLMLGSVAERVLRESRGPVLAVRPTPQPHHSE